MSQKTIWNKFCESFLGGQLNASGGVAPRSKFSDLLKGYEKGWMDGVVHHKAQEMNESRKLRLLIFNMREALRPLAERDTFCEHEDCLKRRQGIAKKYYMEALQIALPDIRQCAQEPKPERPLFPPGGEWFIHPH